jgi:hypothetical protein
VRQAPGEVPRPRPEGPQRHPTSKTICGLSVPRAEMSSQTVVC